MPEFGDHITINPSDFSDEFQEFAVFNE